MNLRWNGKDWVVSEGELPADTDFCIHGKLLKDNHCCAHGDDTLDSSGVCVLCEEEWLEMEVGS